MFYNGILVYILTHIETCTTKIDLSFAVVGIAFFTQPVIYVGQLEI